MSSKKGCNFCKVDVVLLQKIWCTTNHGNIEEVQEDCDNKMGQWNKLISTTSSRSSRLRVQNPARRAQQLVWVQPSRQTTPAQRSITETLVSSPLVYSTLLSQVYDRQTISTWAVDHFWYDGIFTYVSASARLLFFFCILTPLQYKSTHDTTSA